MNAHDNFDLSAQFGSNLARDKTPDVTGWHQVGEGVVKHNNDGQSVSHSSSTVEVLARAEMCFDKW